MSETVEVIPYRPGLEGVTAGLSAVSEIIAEQNKLMYRGYDIRDLAAHAEFEEVAYLLLLDKLPNKRELEAFKAQLCEYRELPSIVYQVIRQLPSEAKSNMMTVLQIGVATLGAMEPLAGNNSHEANVKKAIKLTAQMATLVANGYRILNGQAPVTPNPALNHAANFLYMLHGKEPDPLFAQAMNLSFVLYAEHGYNASTFTAHVIASTLADMHAAVTGAIGALHGPLHGGANEAVMQDLLEIGSPDKAEAWVLNKLANKQRIMGFGHREYKKGDTRAVILKEYVRQLGEKTGNRHWYEIQQIMEEVVLREKGLYPNVDFPAAPVYYMMGIPIPLYTPIFAVARITGWAAHIIEQHDNNRLIRPRHEYTGPRDLPYVPLEQRV